jgi:hypothetical protein
MIDNYVKVIYGWKIPSVDVDKVKDQLGEEIDEALDKFMVYDFGQGLFLYIGAIIGEFNCDDDEGEILVTSKLAGPKIDKFNAFMKNNENIYKVFKKYMRKHAQLYVVQQKW